MNKAENAPDMPGDTMNVAFDCKKVSDVALDRENWAWQDSDLETTLAVGVETTATAVYTGTDKGNYENETVTVKITRSECSHPQTVVRNAKEAGCTEEGYTGDICCTACSKVLTSGTAIPAKGHSYTSVITKQPTTAEEGIRTYTCGGCGHSYTEPVEKLNDSGSGSTDTGNKDAGNADSGNKDAGSAGAGNKDTGSTNTESTEPGNKNTASTDTNTTDAGNGSRSAAPFLKGENGKEGWDVICEDVKAASAGEEITVDMNGTTVAPGNLFELIHGENITVVFDMGNGIAWSVNGKDVTDIKGDIDFGVTFGTEAGKTIPVDVINSITGEHTSMNLTLEYNGEFGFTAALTVNLEEANAGYYANLFYYNPDNSSLEFVCAGQIGKDGNVNLTFTHASDYTIVIAEIIMDEKNIDSIQKTDDKELSEQDAEPASQDSSAGSAKADDSAWRSFWMIMLGSIVVVVGVGIFFINKKKKSE